MSDRNKVTYRVTVLGDGGVGKTAVTMQFVSAQFVESYDPTIEDCYRKQWTVDGETFIVEILDTAGQEEYTALRHQWIKDGEGFLIVYSIASIASFNRIRDIFERVVETKRMQGERRPPVVIVGNKADRGDTDREVSLQMGQNLAAELGADAFFEVSAKTVQGIYESFETLIRLMADVKHGTTPSGNGSAYANGHASKEYGAGGGPSGNGLRRKKKKRNCVIL